MTSAQSAASAADAGGHNVSWLWDRRLYHYPQRPVRHAQLVIAILATVVLYYQLYAIAGVSTLVGAQLHMSFTFLVVMFAIANLVAAFGSLVAGIADRLGRVNLVIWGLLVVGALNAFVVPAVGNRYELGAALCVVGFVEGLLLVATPALVRDFSPQVGRAAALGIWNVGPVAGSLLVALVATLTLAHFGNAWTSQFRIAGIVGLVMFVIALLGMKELAPVLRDQLMVDARDRELVEARAAHGFEANLKSPFTQMFKPDIIGASIGFGTLLLLYFTLVGFSPVLYATVFHFNAGEANGVAAWAWGANVVVTLVVGFLFDWTRLRKPWMLVGGLLTIVFELILLFSIGKALSFAELAVLSACMSGAFGFAAVAYYAGFTETIEARNPALIATGLAIWGWIIRLVAFGAFLLIPNMVTAATTLLEGHSGTADFTAAATRVYGEWRIWIWVCIAGVVVFILTVPLHHGPWTAKSARRLFAEHEQRVAAELAALHRPH